MVRLVVAFADRSHADIALGLVAGMLSLSATPREVSDERTDFALVDIEVDARERDRLVTLIGGVHGLVLGEEAVSGPLVAIAS